MSEFACGQRQLVTDAFPGYAEIAAGAPPLRPVRKNAAAASAMLRQQMSKLVTQSALDFFGAESLQHWIKSDESAARFGPTDRRAHAAIPFNA
jgi:hypothetical protein